MQNPYKFTLLQEALVRLCEYVCNVICKNVLGA